MLTFALPSFRSPQIVPTIRAVAVYGRAWLLACALAFSVQAALAGETINIPDSTVTFEAPTSFTPLTPEEIAAKYLRARPPKYVIGNARRTTSIGYDILPRPIKDAELEQGLDIFGTFMGRAIANLVWKRKEIVEMQGQRWIWLEMTSSAIDTDIYNIMLITPFDGRMVIFNFNSTKEEFAQNEAALRASVASIRLK